jgi:hypothetical protein
VGRCSHPPPPDAATGAMRALSAGHRTRRVCKAAILGTAIMAGTWAVRGFLRSHTTPAPVGDTRPAERVSAGRHGSETGAEPAGPPPSIALAATDEKPGTRFDRQFWVVWALPLLTLTIVSALGARWLFLGAYPGADESDSHQPTGGLLLLIDSKATGIDSAGVSSQAPVPAVALAAETWPTGFDGANELMVKLTFPVTAARSHWYVVASGQYYPDRNLDQNLFCLNGFLVVPETDRIRCRDSPGEGSVDVQYLYNDQLGSTDRDTIRGPIDSLEGFDPERAAIITGTVSTESETPTRIFIPYRAPLVEHAGGDERVRLAPIGVTDQEWGTLRSIGKVANGYTGVSGEFADLESGRTLRYMPLSKLRFDVREDAIGDREIATVVPPPLRPDKLAWEATGAGIGPFWFRLHDPRSADRIAVKAFGAGLIASVGAAALLLLVEQILLRFQRSRDKQEALQE